MANDAIEVDGTVTEILGGGTYKVLIDDMDIEVTAYAAGKMKRYNIKIIPGDIVKVELSPYEPTKGRITYRTINRDVKKKRPQGSRPTAADIAASQARAKKKESTNTEEKKTDSSKS